MDLALSSSSFNFFTADVDLDNEGGLYLAFAGGSLKFTKSDDQAEHFYPAATLATGGGWPSLAGDFRGRVGVTWRWGDSDGEVLFRASGDVGLHFGDTLRVRDTPPLAPPLRVAPVQGGATLSWPALGVRWESSLYLAWNESVECSPCNVCLLMGREGTWPPGQSAHAVASGCDNYGDRRPALAWPWNGPAAAPSGRGDPDVGAAFPGATGERTLPRFARVLGQVLPGWSREDPALPTTLAPPSAPAVESAECRGEPPRLQVTWRRIPEDLFGQRVIYLVGIAGREAREVTPAAAATGAPDCSATRCTARLPDAQRGSGPARLEVRARLPGRSATWAGPASTVEVERCSVSAQSGDSPLGPALEMLP